MNCLRHCYAQAENRPTQDPPPNNLDLLMQQIELLRGIKQVLEVRLPCPAPMSQSKPQEIVEPQKIVELQEIVVGTSVPGVPCVPGVH